MFEMASAAACVLLDQPGAPAAASLLGGVSIPAPLLLAAPSRRPTVVACLMAVADGSLQVQSASGLHMAASISSYSTHSMQPAAVEGASPRRLLLPSLPASGGAGAVVVAQLAANGFGSGTAAEYLMHPAALDASIHAGAVLGLSADPAEASTLSIPAGLQAFAAPSRLGSTAAWAVAGNVALSADSSATSDFLAASGLDHGSTAARLHQLLSRPMRAGTPAAAAQAPQQLLYQVQWLAAEPASLQQQPVLQVSSSAFGKLAWLASPPGKEPAARLQPAAGSPAAVVSGSIAWLQAAATQLASQRIGMHAAASAVEGDSDISGGRAAHSLAAVGVAGLLRTVAREQASSSLYSLLSSRYSSTPPALHAPGAAADAYGTATEGGALRLPRLLTSPADQQLHQQAQPAAGLTGRVLVTGGLGELGLLVGTWLAQHPDVHAVLLGRSAHSKRLPASLQTAQSRLSIVMADVASRGDMAALAANSASSSHAQCSLMHAGGQLADATLAGQTAAGVRAVLAPKQQGSQLLLQLVAAAPVQQAALFSSTAALIGPAGQANYAAANAMLGALAAEQQARGHSSTSILWGAWSVGMAGRDAALSARINSSGMGLIAPAAGLRALAGLMAQRQPHHASFTLATPALVATPFNWPRLQQASRGAVPPMFEEFGGDKSAEGTTRQHAPSRRTTAKTATARLSEDQLAAQISGVARALVGAEVSRLDSRCLPFVFDCAALLCPHVPTICLSHCLALQVPVDEPLMSAGMDSLAAVELRNSLQSAFGVDLPATVTFDHPSIGALARHIAGLLALQGQGAVDAEEESKGAVQLSTSTSGMSLAGITAELQGIVAGMLGANVAPDQPLMEAGLDSLGESWPAAVLREMDCELNHCTDF